MMLNKKKKKKSKIIRPGKAFGLENRKVAKLFLMTFVHRLLASFDILRFATQKSIPQQLTYTVYVSYLYVHVYTHNYTFC